MLIHDFHSKLMSGKDEGRLFEVLRRLNGIESTRDYAQQESATWSQWSDICGVPASSSLAVAKA